MLEKIASFLILRKAISANASLIGSLLVGVALVFLLGLIASLLITALIAGGIYVLYHTLIAHGVTSLMAAYIVGSIILMALIIVILLAVFCLFRIKEIPRQLTAAETRLNRHIDIVIGAFMDGLEAAPARK